MFTVYILGGGKRFTGATIEELVEKLERERITISHSQLKRLKYESKICPNVVIWATRCLTNSERAKLSMKPKHLSNPFHPVPDTEDVQIRFLRENRK